MFGVSALLAALQLGLMLACMPRSPRWLMAQKRYAEARDVLLKIRNSQVRILLIPEIIYMYDDSIQRRHRWTTPTCST